MEAHSRTKKTTKKKSATHKSAKEKKVPSKGKRTVAFGDESSSSGEITLAKRKGGKRGAPPVDFAKDLTTAIKDAERQERMAVRSSPTPEALRGKDGLREEPPEGGPMPFADPPLTNPQQTGTQRMVASARDLMVLKALHELRPEVYGTLTPNQLWVLLAAERKGDLQSSEDLRRSQARLTELNEQFGTTYQRKDLPGILKALRTRRLASNFFPSLPPGGNRETGKSGDTLLDLFIADPEGRFRNVWETGTSQASTDFSQRGGVEERFGYAYSLKRTDGEPLGYIGGKFATAPQEGPLIAEDDDSPAANYLRVLRAESPNYLNPREMPKYGAAVGHSQDYGVSARFGSSVVYWKKDLDWRTTRTPGDSWSNEYLQSAVSFVSADHPESIFAYTDPHVARLAAAEGTGFKRDPELEAKVESAGGADIPAYIEAQIHGDLSWHDVDEVVLNYGTFGAITGDVVISLDEAKRDAEKLTAFAKEKGYRFTVRIGREHTVSKAEK